MNTPITPPRVPIIDPRTGFVDRAWYMFFLSLNDTAASIDPNIAPAYQDQSGDFGNLYAQAQLASLMVRYDECCAIFAQELGSIPSNNTLDLSSDIQSLSLAPANTPQLNARRYGYFYDLNDQTAAAINTAYAITFSNTDYSLGVTRGSPTSRIYVDRPGLYNIQFSAQLDKSSANAGQVWIWLDHNGTTVANSATQVTLQGSSAAAVAAWNFVLKMNANDYFRLMWATNDTDCIIKHDAAAAPIPVIPSVILSVTDNIE